MYMVEGLLTSVIEEVFKDRVEKSMAIIGAFDEVLAAAIAADLSAVRFAAIKAAEKSEVVQEGCKNCKFRPEVQAELQALWLPIWPAVRVKRARLTKPLLEHISPAHCTQTPYCVGVSAVLLRRWWECLAGIFL
jgi:hypothetical protein